MNVYGTQSVRVRPLRWLMALVMLGFNWIAWAGDAGHRSHWDAALPGLEITNVHLQSSSLTKSWQQINRQFGVRTVLVWTNEVHQPFVFDSARCSFAQLLAAFETNYPAYTHTRDKTGIIWLHPRGMAYADILPGKVRVHPGAESLPMLDDIWAYLSSYESLGLRTSWIPGGTSYDNTFNVPVTLPAGVYSVREIINRCCLAWPCRTFGILLRDQAEISLDNINSLTASGDLPGHDLFWHSEMVAAANMPPTPARLIAFPADPDPAIREKARRYCYLCLWSIPGENLVARTDTPESSLWVSVGLLDVMVHTEGTTFRAGTEKIKDILQQNAPVSPGLKVLAAMEYARVTSDTTFLEQAARQPLSEVEIAGVRADLIRNVNYSSLIRQKLMELNPPWPGFSKPEIEALAKFNYFSLP